MNCINVHLYRCNLFYLFISHMDTVMALLDNV